jgi:ELWxxDGT repeat protein
VDGGAGADTLLGAGGADLLSGGDDADRLRGGAAVDTLLGGDGNDSLDGQAGDDLIEAGQGRDVASGGSGADTLLGGAGNDTLFGHAGDDLLEGGAGADLLIGGATRGVAMGRDMAAYSGSAVGVAVDLRAGTGAGGDAEGDKLLHIADLRGSVFADTLTGDFSGNRLEGAGGYDVLSGGGGADTLAGGVGSDRLLGGFGRDVVVFEGRLAEYDIGFGADGAFATVSRRDGTESDTLQGIERLRFADATVEAAQPAEERVRFVFAADAPGMKGVLWASDGTPEGTYIVKSFGTSRDWAGVSALTPVKGGGWLFWAREAEGSTQPWLTDGTEAGTRPARPGVPQGLAAAAGRGHTHRRSCVPLQRPYNGNGRRVVGVPRPGRQHLAAGRNRTGRAFLASRQCFAAVAGPRRLQRAGGGWASAALCHRRGLLPDAAADDRARRVRGLWEGGGARRRAGRLRRDRPGAWP